MIDLTGQKFGRLIVAKRDNDKNRHSMWLCMCDCGKEKIIRGSNLESGKTKSCGCLSIEKIIQRLTKHGHSRKNERSRTYISWDNINKRCTNPNYKYYHHYGGRGITVCNRWKKFINFLEDMGERPQGQQIDRINNNGNYCKSNCQWATLKEQQRNTRRNHLITFNGKTQCIAAWAEELNINRHTLTNRINRGWSTKKVLTTPVRKRLIE